MVKDKKNKMMQVRINDEDYRLFRLACVCVGQTPSETIRMFINTTISALKIKVNKGEINLEDLQTLLDDNLEQ